MTKEELENAGHLTMIKYFCEEKGDIERYCDWKKIKPDVEREFPELIKALADLKNAEKTVKYLVENLL